MTAFRKKSTRRQIQTSSNSAELGDSYFCGGATEVEAYRCEDSSYVTKCDCPDDLCNVNRNAAGKGGGAPNWLAVHSLLVTVSPVVDMLRIARSHH